MASEDTATLITPKQSPTGLQTLDSTLNMSTTDSHKERMNKLMAELPFEVRAVIDDDPSIYASSYSEYTPSDNEQPEQKQLCLPSKCCNLGIGLQRSLLIIVGIFVGLLMALFISTAIMAFAIPDAAWEGGVCRQGWTQYMGDCYIHGGKSSGETYANANANCVAIGGNIVSSSKAIQLLTMLDKMFSSSNSMSPRGSWWVNHTDTCASVDFFPSNNNQTNGIPSEFKSKISVVVIEKKCTDMSGVLCISPPLVSSALRYAKALRVALSLGLYSE
ncbi:Envelope protein UL45 [Cacatuid alphaherpesvirus 2]|uniref:Envelope protein UL45 n=1 Tax=Cacatuid alphaherpesvirus 2 TaxID=2604840 RepID=A0A5B9R2Q3_9ALPH|nr:Envelope protein UL45 [Cacatuid alphaherpesvirus 2]QEG54094.1 Envelope protein UL45 [Cacatuid alphaherpesvirus 2]